MAVKFIKCIKFKKYIKAHIKFKVIIIHLKYHFKKLMNKIRTSIMIWTKLKNLITYTNHLNSKIWSNLQNKNHIYSLFYWKARTSFTKPRKLGQQLNTFSKIAKIIYNENIFSKKCNKCALFGHYSKYDNMVEQN